MTGALDRRDLAKTGLPETQDMRRQPERFGDVADRAQFAEIDLFHGLPDRHA